MGKTKTSKASAAPEHIALDSSNQTAFTKVVKKLRKSMKAEKLEKEERYRRGIILVSHLPFGFFEEALKGFFTQFGKVIRMRLARSPKTGNSKGYAFVEFEFYEVAKIAAESMNNYLMYGRLIKCKLLDQNINSKKLFAGKTVRKDIYPKLIRRNKLKVKLEEPVDEDAWNESKIRRIARNNTKLAAIGIDYKYDDVEYNPCDANTVHIISPVKKISQEIKVEESMKNDVDEDDVASESITTAKAKSPAKKSRKSENNKILTKSPKSPKFSPKILRSKSKKNEETSELLPVKVKSPAAAAAVEKVKNSRRKSEKIEMRKSPKFSPKMLRSKARKSEVSSEMLTTTTIKKTKSPPPVVVEKKLKKSRKSEVPSEELLTTIKTKSPPVKKSRKSEKVDLPKFSPKMLRSKSRKSSII